MSQITEVEKERLESETKERAEKELEVALEAKREADRLAKESENKEAEEGREANAHDLGEKFETKIEDTKTTTKNKEKKKDTIESLEIPKNLERDYEVTKEKLENIGNNIYAGLQNASERATELTSEINQTIHDNVPEGTKSKLANIKNQVYEGLDQTCQQVTQKAADVKSAVSENMKEVDWYETFDRFGDEMLESMGNGAEDCGNPDDTVGETLTHVVSDIKDTVIAGTHFISDLTLSLGNAIGLIHIKDVAVDGPVTTVENIEKEIGKLQLNKHAQEDEVRPQPGGIDDLDSPRI